jgi:hypothetical protein
MAGALSRLEIVGEGGEPGELHFGVPAGVGVARQRGDPPQRLFRKLDGEPRTMRPQQAPQAAQRHPEVVQRFVAIPFDELRARFRGALELHQRQAAHGLFRRTRQRVSGIAVTSDRSWDGVGAEGWRSPGATGQ